MKYLTKGYIKNIKLSQHQDELLSFAVINDAVFEKNGAKYKIATKHSEKTVNIRTINKLKDYLLITESEHDKDNYIVDIDAYTFYIDCKTKLKPEPFYFDGIKIYPEKICIEQVNQSRDKLPLLNFNYRRFLNISAESGCGLIEVYNINDTLYVANEKGLYKSIEI